MGGRKEGGEGERACVKAGKRGREVVKATEEGVI